MKVRVFTQSVQPSPGTLQLPRHHDLELDAAEVAAITSSETVHINGESLKVTGKTFVFIEGLVSLDVYCESQ
ncbi:hypothetical protein [Candidatus Pristimantibacillus sp. PTI5]|uniref:hypothetical protein n=1 Tax=Candidatus Pristimantibacillus sp. PTI5 TaxID=3400422 RepID=UPI003B0267CE